MLKQATALAVIFALAACGGSSSKSGETETHKTDAATETGRTAGYNPDRNAYFGDLHIHTRSSFDAYIFNVRRTADDAYRFALGETIQHPSGFDMTIAGGPLDFYTVTDHSEYLGILPAMDTPGTKLSELPRAKDMFSTEPEKIQAAFQGVGLSVRTGKPIEDMYDLDTINSVWMDNVAAADKYYQPGKFTTFAAYEYTSVTSPDENGGFGGGNLHRNVFFKGKAPVRAFSSLDSTNPEDLWDWMDTQREAGMEVISIPHNSNVSDGQMFRLETYTGEPLDSAYAEQRMRNEPLVEVTQVKGTSETHPDLSPNDEWANFEIYDQLLGSNVVGAVKGSYVREAYRNGLKLQEENGFDPFHFGLVAASDSHAAGGVGWAVGIDGLVLRVARERQAGVPRWVARRVSLDRVAQDSLRIPFALRPRLTHVRALAPDHVVLVANRRTRLIGQGCPRVRQSRTTRDTSDIVQITPTAGWRQLEAAVAPGSAAPWPLGFSSWWPYPAPDGFLPEIVPHGLVGERGGLSVVSWEDGVWREDGAVAGTPFYPTAVSYRDDLGWVLAGPNARVAVAE